jgi:hypothetical protein
MGLRLATGGRPLPKQSQIAARFAGFSWLLLQSPDRGGQQLETLQQWLPLGRRNGVDDAREALEARGSNVTAHSSATWAEAEQPRPGVRRCGFLLEPAVGVQPRAKPRDAAAVQPQ